MRMCYVKLINGEDILAKAQDSEAGLHVVDPCRVWLSPNSDGSVHAAFVTWKTYAQNQAIIPYRAILAIMDMSPLAQKHYLRFLEIEAKEESFLAQSEEEQNIAHTVMRIQEGQPQN